MDVADVTYQGYQRKEVFTKINVKLPERPNNHTKRLINMKVDNGAMRITLPLRIFRQMMDHALHGEGVLDDFTPRDGKVDYQTRMLPTVQRTQHYMPTTRHLSSVMFDWKTFQFHVVDIPSPAVCGITMDEALGLITLHCSMDVPTLQCSKGG